MLQPHTIKHPEPTTEPVIPVIPTGLHADVAQHDLLETAWGIIANAGGGDWTKETEVWQEAAARWRERYHATILSEKDERDG